MNTAQIGMCVAQRYFDKKGEIAVEGNYPNRIVKRRCSVQYDKDENEVARIEYGIEPISGSEWDQLFMKKKAYCVPSEIIKIVESCGKRRKSLNT